jgi:hypothetical protein
MAGKVLRARHIPAPAALAMKDAPFADRLVRFASPELAAEKLGWTLARVLKRREALGLGPFVTGRNRKVGRRGAAKAASSVKPVKSPAKGSERRKPAKRRVKG